jgi:hypothetical protein
VCHALIRIEYCAYDPLHQYVVGSCPPHWYQRLLNSFRDPQNLARQRASKFAQEDPLDSSVLTPGSHSHTLHSTSSSIVVTTTANVDLDVNGWQTDEDFLTKPRGYFADQFEVSPEKPLNVM